MKKIPAPSHLIQAEQCKRSLHRFVREAWKNVEGTPFVDGWHIELICKALEHAFRGELPDNNLYINIPPVHMKTLLVAVFFPAWVWAQDAGKKFLCISYSEALENKSARKCRNLLESEWYRERFGVLLSRDNNQVGEFTNMAGGVRYSVGIGGTITGRHADFIIMDDLLSAADAISEVEIERVNWIYDDVIPSRLADPKKSVKIIICQRLSKKDIIGHIESKRERYEKIILPAEYEGPRYTSQFPELTDPRMVEGDLLWPARMGAKEIADKKLNMSEMGYSGQYQQRPSPPGGLIFRAENFRRVLNTEVAGRIISIDTAFGSSIEADFSSIVVGEFTYDYHLFIRDVVRGRWAFPQLIEAIERAAQEYRHKLRKIIIESKASGMSVIQTLNQGSIVIHDLEYELGLVQGTLIAPNSPTENKIVRANLVSQWCEKGCVLLPPPDPVFPWLMDFEEELFSFPLGANDDQVDAFTQLLSFCSAKLSEGLNARGG